MKISIIGCGYVGLVTGVCLADRHDHEIYFIDTNQSIISALKKNKIHFYEKGLEEKLLNIKKKNKIHFSTQYNEFIEKTDLTFVCVGTPSDLIGKINLRQIKDCSKKIGKVLEFKEKFHAIIYKSTIPPGTITEVCVPILERSSKKKINLNFGVGSNPEFLREGSAVYDFENSSRIVIGSQEFKTKSLINKVYKKFIKKVKFINVNIKTAEMIKYFSNSFFSLLISFANEFGNLCSKINVDFTDVIEGLKFDRRISPRKNLLPEFIKYLYPGIGYGGSCFPKDVKALINFSKKQKSELKILKKVDEINEKQPKIIAQKILQTLKKNNFNEVLILGITFKENSDDLRNSTSIKLIEELAKKAVHINVYDPLINKVKFKKIDFNNSCKKFINFVDNKNGLSKFKFIVVNNKSKEYKDIIFKIKNKKFFLFDSRRYFKKNLFTRYSGSGL